MTNNSETGGSVSSVTRPPDLREEEEEVVKVADDGSDAGEEEELNSEACMEILQEALDEAAGGQEPYKYQPEPGGSQVPDEIRRPQNLASGSHSWRIGGGHFYWWPSDLPGRPKVGDVCCHRRGHHGLCHWQNVRRA